MPMESCLMGSWIYFKAERIVKITDKSDTAVLVENPMENSFYEYSMEDTLGLSTITQMHCLNSHLIIEGRRINPKTDAQANVKRLVVLTHGGEKSFIYKRILTSYNFMDNLITNPTKEIKQVSESDEHIYINYIEAANSNLITLVINKKGP